MKFLMKFTRITFGNDGGHSNKQRNAKMSSITIRMLFVDVYVYSVCIVYLFLYPVFIIL